MSEADLLKVLSDGGVAARTILIQQAEVAPDGELPLRHGHGRADERTRGPAGGVPQVGRLERRRVLGRMYCELLSNSTYSEENL